MGMKSSHVMGIAQPVPLLIGVEEPGENQMLMSSIFLIQLQKLLKIISKMSNVPQMSVVGQIFQPCSQTTSGWHQQRQEVQ